MFKTDIAHGSGILASHVDIFHHLVVAIRLLRMSPMNTENSNGKTRYRAVDKLIAHPPWGPVVERDNLVRPSGGLYDLDGSISERL